MLGADAYEVILAEFAPSDSTLTRLVPQIAPVLVVLGEVKLKLVDNGKRGEFLHLRGT